MVASAPEPRALVRDVLLRDGQTLRLQTPTPVDYEDIKAFYDGLSPERRYLRFQGFGRTDTVARADAEAGGVDRLALLGRLAGRVVAVASYDGLREPGVAEVAFGVADDDQGRGIGMRMLEQLAEIAAGRGIHRFDAEVAAGNRLMLGVFEHAGFAVRRKGFQAGLSRGAAFRLLPVTDAEADELINSAESVATQLDGFRGSALLDRAALRELILRFTLLLLQVPEVVEADLNPVRCMTNGCVVLDMRLRIEHRRPVERVKTW